MRENRNKFIMIAITFLVCVFGIKNVYATECTKAEVATLKALAEKIEFSKKFINPNTDEKAFTLVGHNLNDNLILEFPNGLRFQASSSDEEIMAFLDGSDFTVDVYASEKHICESVKITTLNVRLNTYNKYYGRKECKGKESVDICKEWYDSENISEEEFLKLVKEAEVTNPPIKNTNWFIKFITKNWMIICGVVLVVGISYGTVSMIRRKKRVKIDI